MGASNSWMGKPRKTRTDEELRAASLHLAYEWDALTAALGGILKVNDATASDLNTLTERLHLLTVWSAIYESFALHARSLMHFAYPDSPIFPEDVLALDYISEWETVRPPIARHLTHATAWQRRQRSRSQAVGPPISRQGRRAGRGMWGPSCLQ